MLKQFSAKPPTSTKAEDINFTMAMKIRPRSREIYFCINPVRQGKSLKMYCPIRCNVRCLLHVYILLMAVQECRSWSVGRSKTLPVIYSQCSSSSTRLFLSQENKKGENDLVEEEDGYASVSRRQAVFRGAFAAIGGAMTSSNLLTGSSSLVALAAGNEDLGYKPAKRPTAYRVDSTQPPTLLPLVNAQKEMSILSGLGKGSGTDKNAIIVDTVNLNNVLNKAVFGTIDAVSSLTGNSSKNEDALKKSGTGYASFVCLGLPSRPTDTDVDLAINLATPMVQARSSKNGAETALGLAFLPLSTQSDLDAFGSSSGSNIDGLVNALVQKGVNRDTITQHLPLIQFAKTKALRLLAMAPEAEDIATARRKGLQYVDGERRTSYVADTQGFIDLSQDPRYRVYADRSLLKDFTPLNDQDSVGFFFSERILVHETAAGVAAKYAVTRPDALVLVVAPTPDVRFLQGINGRIARICAFLNPDQNKVTEDAITTILLNPTAQETLSKSRYLRLEVGTGPETLDYQAKVADYLWFSSSPKVNLIPRLMNG